MALKPKDVRVPLPVQLIFDCHWLVCVRGEGLTDRSIAIPRAATAGPAPQDPLLSKRAFRERSTCIGRRSQCRQPALFFKCRLCVLCSRAGCAEAVCVICSDVTLAGRNTQLVLRAALALISWISA